MEARCGRCGAGLVPVAQAVKDGHVVCVCHECGLLHWWEASEVGLEDPADVPGWVVEEANRLLSTGWEM